VEPSAFEVAHFAERRVGDGLSYAAAETRRSPRGWILDRLVLTLQWRWTYGHAPAPADPRGRVGLHVEARKTTDRSDVLPVA
jgi:hypothetical protein